MKEVRDTCVYMHIKKTNREAFYIGIGNDKRPYHKGNKRSKWWHRVANKYGYEVVILAENLYWSDACKIEIDLIKYFGRRDLGEGPLVNMTDGGEGKNGTLVSAETRAKMSLSQTGKKQSKETIAKRMVAHTGKKRSAETRANISASQTGKKLSAETKTKISITLTGRKLSAETRAKISKANKGDCHSLSKLTQDQVIEIITELRDNTYKGQNIDLGNKYGVEKACISKIKTNRTWKHICRETLTVKE